MRLVKANEATAARRTVYFHLVDATDGMTTETGEAGGQPQVSSDGAAFTNTGIGTLTHFGNGRYSAVLTQALVATAGTQIETRYKSSETAESPGDSVQVVGFDPYDAIRLGLQVLPEDALVDAVRAEVDSSIINAQLATLTGQQAAQQDLDTITDTGVVATNMRGTDNAALASVCTEGRLAELDAANIPADLDTVKVDVAGLDGAAMRGTDSAATAASLATAQTAINSILADTGTDGVVLSSATMQAIATTLLDLSNGIETGITLREVVRAIAAVLAGTTTGGPGSPVFNSVGGATQRVASTSDEDGNRSGVSLSL